MSGLDDFRRFFVQFVGLITAGVATTALVLVSALAGLAPPWPAQIVQITAIAQLLALIFVYQFAGGLQRGKLNGWMKRALAVLCISLVVYLALFSLLFFQMPDGANQVRGFKCTANAEKLFAASCPFLPDADIAAAQFTPDRLWTPISLALSRLTVLVSWICSFAALVSLVGAFVVFQRKKP